jgi:hypothetical protein
MQDRCAGLAQRFYREWTRRGWDLASTDHAKLIALYLADHPGLEPGCVMRLQADAHGLLGLLRAYQAEVERLRTNINEEISSNSACYARIESAQELRAIP